MTTPSEEQRVLRLSEQDCKAVLLFLYHRYPFEVGHAIDAVTGRKG
jgi:hypothetical protein